MAVSSVRFAKADRRVTAYYFYVVDEAFGPAFMKVCAYFPYSIKVWLNGHGYSEAGRHSGEHRLH